jgi:hypothetical protein
MDIASLPPELLEHHVFPFLPPPSLIVASMVSKKFNKLILKEIDRRKVRLRHTQALSPKICNCIDWSHKNRYLMLFEEGSASQLHFFIKHLKYPNEKLLQGLFLQLCFAYSLMSDRLDMMMTLILAGHEFPPDLIDVAARRGQLATLKWLVANGNSIHFLILVLNRLCRLQNHTSDERECCCWQTLSCHRVAENSKGIKPSAEKLRKVDDAPDDSKEPRTLSEHYYTYTRYSPPHTSTSNPRVRWRHEEGKISA